MVDAASLRDSTQIVLTPEAAAEIRADVESRFTVTFYEQSEYVKIIGSPVVIKEVGDYLCRQGITLP
ncbi:MAG: hypothetical protein ABEJ67_03860 [Halanaeroarchaeum sp.]